MTADLQELLARVEKAGGPDRELDARIFCAVNGYTFRSHRPDLGPPPTARAYVAYYEPKNGEHPSAYCPAFTASLDAALALVERVLPTFTADLTIYRTNGGEFKPHSLARLFCPYGEIQEHRGDARSPALALLAAALRALISNTEAAG